MSKIVKVDELKNQLTALAALGYLKTLADVENAIDFLAVEHICPNCGAKKDLDD